MGSALAAPTSFASLITMKFLLLICLVGLASSMYTETKEEFNKEQHLLESAPDEIKEKEEKILKETEDEINKNNKDFEDGKSSYSEKLSIMSDMTDEELKLHEGGDFSDAEGRGLGLIMPPLEERISSKNLDEVYAELDRQSIPKSYNALSIGMVTPVKNQGACGSCAAFAAHGQHETAMVMAGALLSGLDLSEQYLVDCAYGLDGANGCKGAQPHIYSKFMHENAGGVSLHENDYPYLGRNPKLNCNAANKIQKWNSGAKITKATWDWYCNEAKLKKLIATKGAVVVGIYAGGSFRSYSSGVWNGCTQGAEINHAVLAVGYGNENGKDYWLIKNSWGTNWGDSGYIKIQRGTNHCNVGNFCVWTDAAKDRAPGVVPTARPTTQPPLNLWCDVSKLFGKNNITGNYNLRVWVNDGSGWKPIESKVRCVNSKCTPRQAGPTNACMYICGKQKC